MKLDGLNGFFPDMYRDFMKELGDRLFAEDGEARVERLRESVLGDEYKPARRFTDLAEQVSVPTVPRQ